MKLHEIIAISEESTKGILIELIIPYKKSLKTYFERTYNSEPVLIVTDVFNACQYGFICPANEMSEAIDIYLNASQLNEEEKENEREIISAQSMMLYSL